MAAPHAGFDDGLVHLCWVRSGIGRRYCACFWPWSAVTTSAWAVRHLGYARSSCLCLEPLTPRRVLTVDGEQVEYGPQAQVHPGLYIAHT